MDGSEGAGGLPALLRDRPFLVEVFIAFNLAFLALDVYVAHSARECCGPRESVPIVFTTAAALVLIGNLAVSAPIRRGPRHYAAGLGRWIGLVAGGLSVAVGVTGLIFHLQSNFFQAMTLRNLVYSAPFIAPLAFTGLGLLLLLNRLVDPREVEWGRWVLLLAWGGFVGNFVLSLVDHAQNGFFYFVEWIPVAVAALTVGWLILPALLRTPTRFLRLAYAVLAVAAVTGVAGFVLHGLPALTEEAATLRYRVIYGAPLFAPLLFPNLALLGALAVWDLEAKRWVAREPADITP